MSWFRRATGNIVQSHVLRIPNLMKKLLLTAVALAALAPSAVARVRAVRHPAEKCAYSIAPTWGNDQLPASGLQRGVVLVYGQTALCSQWMAYSSVDWVTVEGAPAAAQPAAYVTLAANPTTQARTASLTIAGIRLDVTQEPAAGVAPPATPNLVKNGTFDKDLANWGWNRPVNGTGTVSWSQLDANGNAASGSMLLRGNRTSSNLAYQQLQCIPMGRSLPYLFGAKVRTSETSDRGEGIIAVFTYPEVDCSGDYTSTNIRPLGPMAPGEWREFKFTAVTGSRTQAVLLVIGSAANVSTFDTWFDDVFVEP